MVYSVPRVQRYSMPSSGVWRLSQYQHGRLTQGFSAPLVAYLHRTHITQENVSEIQSFVAESWHLDETLILEESDTFAHLRSNLTQEYVSEIQSFVAESWHLDETLLLEESDTFAHLRSNLSSDQGLSQDTILKLLKTRSFVNSKDGKDSGEGPEICVICQDEYEENERIGRLHCGHEYHVDCISKWLLQKKVCPICKAESLPDGRNS